MKINTADFLISNSDYTKCPAPNKPEYAFIGRSNVGKSSLINSLCGRKKLAKTSGTPGKTQLINHFSINNEWYLVDLPGYGYAKVAKTERKKWSKFTRNYLLDRKNLMCVMVLLDSRIPLQKVDADFMEWLGIKRIPFVMIFTKADKLTSSELGKNMLNYKKEMLKNWEVLPKSFITSAIDKRGNQEVLNYIEAVNPNFSPV